jgi:uncharacterized oxidoreductase
MQLSGNTILVTGGGSGIGLAIARRFLERENTVIICGRREEALKEAAERYPGMISRACDLAEAEHREALAKWAAAEFPELNVLVNNAGIQRRGDLKRAEDWELTHSEIAINLEAPIHLTRLLYDQLASRPAAAILNVTSGLSFAPLANVPVYSATKAAFHSFTLSLRHQLADTSVEVVELVPPAVDTDLGGPGLHTFGVGVDEFADAVFDGLGDGRNEIAYGTALQACTASRDELDTIFSDMNRRFR